MAALPQFISKDTGLHDSSSKGGQRSTSHLPPALCLHVDVTNQQLKFSMSQTDGDFHPVVKGNTSFQ
jgi:hypothetical protein